VEAYCVKCKAKRTIEGAEATFTSTGVPASRGTCTECGTKLFRMGRTEAHEGMAPPPRATRKKHRSARKGKGRLVIVESPAKARTVGRYLGSEYVVRASLGHVRDLLRSKLSVDVDNGFKPQYRVPREKKDVVKGLKGDVAKAAEVYLATDPDREGEAIAWHLLEAAEIDAGQARRVVFHEITQSAIEEAFRHPRAIDLSLVDAQQARRILDRLVGYNLSPLLWAKVRGRLSAGRVQSVALRLVVDREREIGEFEAQEYWSIEAEFLQPGKPPAFKTALVQMDEGAPELANAAQADEVVQDIRAAEFQVESVRHGTRTRRPQAPFTTSTLQQDASRRLGFTARRTMAVAQQLYEGVDLGQDEPTGLITYMRTDSPGVSPQAQAEVRRLIGERFGEAFVPDDPPTYKARSRTAQEAHEAIRPTSVMRDPEDLRRHLTGEQVRLYTLIWQRFVASQMNPAEYDTLTIEVGGKSPAHAYLFRATASNLRFAGFVAVYQDVTEDNGNGDHGGGLGAEQQLDRLPAVEEGDSLILVEAAPEQHFTQPPPRFTEASLVRALEENGIGRPSTYAPILTTIQQRGYVRRDRKRLLPTDIGETVIDLLVDHFPEIVDLGFTARMEDELDEVAEGSRKWTDVIEEFYRPFAEQLKRAEDEMPEMRQEPEEIQRACPECGKPLVIRHGRYGKFIGCSDFPQCRYTEPWLEKIGVRCPEDAGDLVERRTKRGRMFYGCANYPACEFTSWKRPMPEPCPNCGGLLVMENRDHAVCLACGEQARLVDLRSAMPDLA
jgi:DNA topoisomerase-1